MQVSASSRPNVSTVAAAAAGLAAGIVMALVAMMATAFMGMGLFAPPAMIAGIVLGPGAAMSPGPSVIMTGLVLHMVLSMMFGVIFALLANRVRGEYLVLGLMYGLALWVVNFYILSFVSPGARAMATHEPVWLAASTHVAFGLVLGGIIARVATSSSQQAR